MDGRLAIGQGYSSIVGRLHNCTYEESTNGHTQHSSQCRCIPARCFTALLIPLQEALHCCPNTGPKADQDASYDNNVTYKMTIAASLHIFRVCQALDHKRLGE